MKRKAILIPAVALLVVVALALCIWFIPNPAGRWGKQELSLGYVGAFERNGALDELSYVELGGHSHPETVLVRDGWIYLTSLGGSLVKLREDGSDLTTILDTGGCLLGFEFDREGRIVVVDCDYAGTGALLRVADEADGAVEVLASRDTGFPLYYPNAIAIATDGTIYFTDSTTAFTPPAYGGSSSAAAANEALMHTCTGRVLAYEPSSGTVRTLADGFAFSNGVALSQDEQSLFVCETYRYAVRRIQLDSGDVSDFLTNLPCFPDNLTKGLDGRYWVGFNGERSDSLDAISDQPLLRKAVWLYDRLFPAKETAAGGYCHVFAFTEDGATTESLQSATNGYVRSTGATETAQRLYIQSINDTGKLAYVARGGDAAPTP